MTVDQGRATLMGDEVNRVLTYLPRRLMAGGHQRRRRRSRIATTLYLL